MKQCVAEKLYLQLILGEHSFPIINDIAETTNVSIHRIFLTSIVALCHWTMETSLKGAQAYNTPLILFGILCGGSGKFQKSAPIRVVKEACEAVEALDRIPAKNSSINASVNMESLCCELERQSIFIQLWDELAVFMGIFGNTRIDRAAYDRGLMCEFYSRTGIVRRQLVSRHNVMIKPRLNILAAGHPKRIIECLTGASLKCQDQKDQAEDGLFNRFIIAVPYKHRPNRETIEPNDQIPKLAHLFYLIKNFIVLQKNICYQKSIKRVERLALALHIFKICSRRLFNMMDNIQSFGILDDQFKADTCFRASLLAKFYLNPTIILAGYDPSTDHILGNKKLLLILHTTQMIKMKELINTCYFTDTMDVPEQEVKHIKKYIENHPSDRLLLSSLPAILKRKISKDQYLVILQQMEEEGKGKIEETNNTTGPKGIVFIKKKKTDQQTKVSLTTNQQQINQSLPLNHQETNEASTTNLLVN
ncbi:unnamed protein product [Rotaria magnacalcarata]|uniref:Uncharacterized protein n=3 Tax=Rotaria magnacalcarata TaxID=392030 RepID=A0A8S2RUH3_9BILA|nr:unnamed protein product [Rotaria magnacalcarata]